MFFVAGPWIGRFTTFEARPRFKFLVQLTVSALAYVPHVSLYAQTGAKEPVSEVPSYSDSGAAIKSEYFLFFQ